MHKIGVRVGPWSSVAASSSSSASKGLDLVWLILAGVSGDGPGAGSLLYSFFVLSICSLAYRVGSV